LSVRLSSSDISEARVPALAIIPAGAASVTFSIVPVDDGVADGTQRVTITASASGLSGASAQLTVLDAQRPTLSVTIGPARIRESGRSSATVIVRRNTEITPATRALRVALSASPLSQVRLPLAVTIPARAAQAAFTVAAIDDSVADGPYVVTVTARALGFAAGSGLVFLSDDEAASSLSISGRVTTAPPGAAAGVAGVTLTLRSGSVARDIIASDAGGAYRFSGLPPGVYTVSPTSDRFSFGPTSRSVVLPRSTSGAPGGSPSQAGQDFSARPRPVILSLSSAVGAAGSTVSISGLALDGALVVKFGGVPARFVVVSRALIRAVVPSGALAGHVSVVTPLGVAVSAQSFQIPARPAPFALRASTWRGRSPPRKLLALAPALEPPQPELEPERAKALSKRKPAAASRVASAWPRTRRLSVLRA